MDLDLEMTSGERRFSVVATASENRRSYRYPVLPGNEEASIHLDGKTVEATLLEESAGGFTMEVEAELGLKVGQTLVIHIHSGWFKVEVRNVTPRDERQRVGLMRLRNLPPPEEGGGIDKLAPSLNYTQFALFGLCILVGGVVTLTVSQPGWMTDWLGERMGATASQVARTPINTEFSTKIPDFRTKRILEGFNSLTDPIVAVSLRLTPEQVRNIDRTYAEASRDLEAAFVRSSNNPQQWQEESMVVVNTTVQRVLCLLSDDQVRSWRGMLTSKRP